MYPPENCKHNARNVIFNEKIDKGQGKHTTFLNGSTSNKTGYLWDFYLTFHGMV